MMPFKRGGPDPQDCILHLEKLIGLIESNVAEDSSAAKSKKTAMMAVIANSGTWEEAEDQWRDFMEADMPQAFAMRQQARKFGNFSGPNAQPRGDRFNDSTQPVGLCRAYASGAGCRHGDNCRFKHVADSKVLICS